jgi:hypothetical protein
MSNTNTTTDVVNPPKVEKPRFLGKFFDDVISFLVFFDFIQLAETIDEKKVEQALVKASKSMISLCESTGPSRGVKADGYLLDAFKGFPYSDHTKPFIIIIVIHDYNKKIQGFVTLNQEDKETAYLSLICSKVKGGGSYLIDQMKSIFSTKSQYNNINLEAVEGVANVYFNRGFKFVMIGEDKLPIMTFDLNKLRDFQDGDIEGNIENVQFYVTRYGRQVKPVNKLKTTGPMSGVNTNQGGRKRRKTHKNGNKKRRNTRRRR